LDRCRFGLLLALAFSWLIWSAGPALADTTTSVGDLGGEAGGPFAGLLQAPEANLFSGALSHVIPILTPPGRKSATPDLKLVYSSLGGGSSGILGEGWALPLGTIERSAKHGVPRCGTAGYDNTKEFALTLNGATVELVQYAPSGSNIYRPRTDQSFLEAIHDTGGNSWEVKERSGMRYFFGESGESRLSRTGTCAFTAVWGLTHVQDPNGNTIHVTYKTGEQSLVPTKIEYGSQAPSSHPFVIELEYIDYAAASANPTPSYQKGVREEVNDLLNTITVKADGATVRTYQLDYDHEGSFPSCSSARRALLCQVSVNPLPAQRFEYSSDEFGYTATASQQRPDGVSWLRRGGPDVEASLMDVNGDGRLDFVRADQGVQNFNDHTWAVYYGLPNGGVSTSISTYWCAYSGGTSTIEGDDMRKELPSFVIETHKETIDLTGDGIPDFVDATSTPWKVYPGSLSVDCPDLGTMPGFSTTAITWAAPSMYLGAIDRLSGDALTRKRLADMNADGKPDLVIAPETGEWQVWINNGSGFSYAPDLHYAGLADFWANAISFAWSEWVTRLDLFDFNGDGLPDLVQVGNAHLPVGPNDWTVYLNNGSSFDPGIEVADSTGDWGFRIDTSSGLTSDMLDVNADGLPDLVQVANDDWLVSLNTGTSFLPEQNWGDLGVLRKNNSRGNTKIDMVDWNGDGFLDRVHGESSGGTWGVVLGLPTTGPGIRPYLLTAVHNGIGGVSHARYGPSTRYQNTLLPFVSWLLTGTRRTDGLCSTSAADPYVPGSSGNQCIDSGDEIVRTYEYAEGLFDGASREFRGFGIVKEKFVGTAEKGYREAFFNQEEHTRGQVDQEDIYADVGKLTSRETFTWDTKPDGLRTQVWMTEHITETRNIDTAAAVSQCKMERNTTPDVYGRVGTQCTLDCGTTPGVYPPTPDPGQECVGLPDGAVSVGTIWANPGASSDENVRERPRRVVTFGWSGGPAVLVRKNYLYDDLGVGVVDEGNVTKVETEMIGGSASENAVVLNAYDSHGNITSLQGPGTEKSTSTYGAAAFELYPTSERQCLTSACENASEYLETTKSWTIRYGKELAITGPNIGQTTAFSYDAAGRVECEAKPGDSLSDCKDGAAAFTRTAEYTYAYGNPSAAFPANLSHVEVKTREPNSPSGYLVSRSYFDALGRKRLTTSQRVIGAGNTLQTVVGEQVAYDSQGRVVREYSPYTGVPVALPAATVKYTEYGYIVGTLPDPLHRARVMRTPADIQRGKSTTTQYTGDTVTTTDQYGNQTATVSDTFGREVSRKLYGGSASPGNLKLEYGFTYDGLDRVITSTVGSTTVVRTYDSLGNLVALDDPDSGLWSWDYDPSGNPIFQDDPKPDQHIEACYDKLDRVTVECSYADDTYHGNACGLCAGGSSGAGTLLAAYAYDNTSTAAPNCGGSGGKGQLSNVTDFAGTGGECFFYDLRGNVTRNEKTVDNKTAVIHFTYDEVDRLQMITYPSGTGATYTYQADGLPNTLTSAVNEVEYDIFGRITRLVRSNGTEDTYDFDDVGTNNFRLETLQAKKGTTSTYLNLGYLYEDRGKLSQVMDTRDGSGTSGLSNDVVYTYDGVGRLTAVDWNEGQATYDEGFGHADALGNLTCKSAGTTNCTGAFGLGSAGPHQPTSWGPYTQMIYDGNGARLGKDRGNGTRQDYAYDARGRLAQIELYASSTLEKTVGFTYDYHGQRVAKTETGVAKRRYFNQYVDSANGNITLYYYIGTRMVASYTKAYAALSDQAEPTLIAPPERIDVPPAVAVVFGVGVLLLLILPFGRTRLGVRISLARASSISVVLLTSSAPVVLLAGCGPPPNVRHYHIDRLGTVQAVSDFSGNLVEQIRYYAYGEARGRFNSAGNPFPQSSPADELRHEFTGYETDFASGLAYAGARWMDPELGQFHSLDPKRQFPSPYAYGPGDPINGSDPTGEFWGVVAAIALVTAFAAAVDTFIQTGGDWGATLKSFGLSIAGSVVGVGIGLVTTQVVGAIGSEILRASVQVAQYGYAAYGAVDGLANGRPFSAGVSIGLMAYGAFGSEPASGASQRSPDTIHITGHRVGGVGPYHLATEYRPSGGDVNWISGHTPEDGIPVLSDLFGDPITSGINHSSDMPVKNIAIATVTPPAGMSASQYWSSLVSASNACCGGLDYALFPSGVFDGYNSNSFLVGLIQATGGTPSVPLSGFVGGDHPIPPEYYGR
jgi:RHS repeat-associated protein